MRSISAQHRPRRIALARRSGRRTLTEAATMHIASMSHRNLALRLPGSRRSCSRWGLAKYGWMCRLLGGESRLELGVGIELPGQTCGVDERDERFGPVGVFVAGQESEVGAVPRIGDEILRFLRRGVNSASLSAVTAPVILPG
jgi:hypothetical protein